jgi:glycosyltransferase involved in cell wall biosynthesis
MDLSIVMPAHNEMELLAQSVDEVVAGLRGRAELFEVLVVENGSTDGTRELADRLARELPEVRSMSLPRADYGHALRTGFLAAEGRSVVNFDVDHYDLAFVGHALREIGDPPAAAIVVGSKRAEGANDTRAWPRRLVTWTFSTILRWGFGLRVSDTHGMKAVVRARVEPLVRACKFDADIFDTELIIRAQRAGLRVAELPVAVRELRPPRTSIAGRALRTLGRLARLRLVLWREGGPLHTSPL